MSNKVENKEQAVAGVPARFKYADFTLECGKCGEKTVLFENDQGGRKIEHSIFTTEVHEFKMVCEKCNNYLKFYYEEAANPPAEEQSAEEELSAESVSAEQVQEPAEATETQEVEEVPDEEPVQEEDKTEE